MKAVKITLKGRALTAAVDSGLIRRKLSGGIPMRKFERFWALFSPWLSTETEQGDDLYQMVEAPADSAAADWTESKPKRRRKNKMPITINRKTGEVKAPEITQEQRDALWGELVRNYIRKHPEALTEQDKGDDRPV